jgi:hypothetical protein
MFTGSRYAAGQLAHDLGEIKSANNLVGLCAACKALSEDSQVVRGACPIGHTPHAWSPSLVPWPSKHAEFRGA